MTIRKYPRTPHLEGSRLQPGDEDLEQVLFEALPNGLVVVEEKMDGANAAVSFAADGELRLQSRGHHLTGGRRERHFDLFKAWANCHRDGLWETLGSRHIMYGEWLHAKHTVFYDALPHYFLEFDILDVERGRFLSTAARRELLAGLPVVPVTVLWEGRPKKLDEVTSLVGRSEYKTVGWRTHLDAVSRREGLDPERTARETDPSDLMEGLYLKTEAAGCVVARLKWIRPSFLSSVLDSDNHWIRRPILPNQLRADVDLFGASL